MDLKRRELARRLSLRSPMARSASGRPLRTYGRGRGNTAECTQPPTSSTEPAIQGKAGAAGDLDGRDEERCVFDTCRDLRRETRQGGRVPDQRSPGATHLLRTSCRVLGASPYDRVIESSFATRRHGTIPSKGISLEQYLARQDLQARRGSRERLAPPQRVRGLQGHEGIRSGDEGSWLDDGYRMTG